MADAGPDQEGPSLGRGQVLVEDLTGVAAEVIVDASAQVRGSWNLPGAIGTHAGHSASAIDAAAQAVDHVAGRAEALIPNPTDVETAAAAAAGSALTGVHAFASNQLAANTAAIAEGLRASSNELSHGALSVAGEAGQALQSNIRANNLVPAFAAALPGALEQALSGQLGSQFLGDAASVQSALANLPGHAINGQTGVQALSALAAGSAGLSNLFGPSLQGGLGEQFLRAGVGTTSTLANLLGQGHGPFQPTTASGHTPPQPPASDDYQKLAEELETLKVETMSQMVAEVKLSNGESPTTCPFLFLTNRQAAKLTIENMPKVRAAMGIGEPKMVIRLMPARFGAQYWKAFPYYHGRFPTKVVAEISEDERMRTEHQLMVLAEEVLLPLAIRTQALVVGNDSCSLVAAFVKVAAPVQRLMGDQCPFRLLIFARAPLVHLSAITPGTVATQFRSHSKEWIRTDLIPSLEKRFGEDDSYWPCDDLLMGQYCLVLFQSLANDNRISSEVSDNFQNDFISSLAKHLPVIGLATYGSDKFALAPAMADHVNRGLPLMLLDSRLRDYTKIEMSSLESDLASTAEALHASGEHGIVDSYNTSMLAFIKLVLNQTAMQHDDHGYQQTMWIWKAIDKKFDQQVDLRKKGGGSAGILGAAKPVKADADFQKQMDQGVIAATNIAMRYVGNEMEWESRSLTARCEDGIDDVAMADSWPDLKGRLQSNWLKIRGCCFHTFSAARQLAEREPWLTLKNYQKCTKQGRYQLMIDLDCVGDTPLDDAKDKLVKLLREALEVSRDHDSKTKTQQSFVGLRYIWLAVYHILRSENVHATNMYDLGGCGKKLFAIAQIDRLPKENSLETLLLIRRAWTIVDIFNVHAARYKILTKMSYMLALCISISVVTITVIASQHPEVIDSDKQKYALLALSLGSSFACGITGLVDPGRKWLQLRGGALSLESEIWKFRTRVAEYNVYESSSVSVLGRHQAERIAESAFSRTILLIQDQVMQSAGLTNTSFYSVTTATDESRIEPPDAAFFDSIFSTAASATVAVQGGMSVAPPPKTKLTQAHYRHGQYKGGKCTESPEHGEDSHHAPATPQEYIRWRVMPQILFYQHRIPLYANRQRVFQVLLLLASVVSAMLAAGRPGWSSWAALVASASGGLTAWQEFIGVSKKLERYSMVSSALGNILMWWQSLPSVEQADVRNVERLVGQTEGHLGSDRSAWLSDAQAVMKMAQDAAAPKKVNLNVGEKSVSGGSTGANAKSTAGGAS